MSQIFHRSTNTISKVSIFGAVLAIVGLLFMIDRFGRSSWMTQAHTSKVQPVPFSHRHHVGGEGFDCRYCHTSVEKSAFAGIPSTKICMTCHSQIWKDSLMLEGVRESYRSGKSIAWIRVHDLPGFVYFDHSIHVNKGVGCSSCHGRVDLMPLTWQENTLQMDWCVDCHRNPERVLRPREDVFRMDWKPPADQLERGRQLAKDYEIPSWQVLTSCSTCHR
ncbi:MAG: cytochrome c3 family protein [Candidatus Binatia bacterium]